MLHTNDIILILILYTSQTHPDTVFEIIKTSHYFWNLQYINKNV